MNKHSAQFGIIDQIVLVCQARHRIALALGTLLGGFVPIATFTIARLETHDCPLKWLLVVGGLLYSAITVFTWGNAAFQYRAKAFGFVVLLEGVAVTATTPSISVGAVLILVLINAFGTSTTLIIERKASRKRRREVAAAKRSVLSPGGRPARERPDRGVRATLRPIASTARA